MKIHLVTFPDNSKRKLFSQDGYQQGRHDPRGDGGEGEGGVQHWPTESSDRLCQEQHTSPHQLQKQQEVARPREGLRQTLQHGPGGRQGDVDRIA